MSARRQTPASSGRAAGRDEGPPRVLVVTGDAVLADALRRLAAAAAVDAEVVTALPDVASWAASTMVVVGADLAHRAGSATLPRRRAVVLVGRQPYDDAVWQAAVTLGAEQVAVLPDAEAWLVDRFAACGEPPSRARVVGVVGGCGGAGASLLSVALAVTAADASSRVLLADLDPLGGGLDLAVGLDGVPGLRWPDLSKVRGRLPSSSVHDALPRLDDLAVLAWGRGEPLDLDSAAVDAVLRSAAGSHDLVVLDLPRSGDERLLVSALRHVHELLLVVPARLRATAAAVQVAERWRSAVPDTGLVVRRSPGDRLSGRSVADAVQLPLSMQMKDEPGLDGRWERGTLPGLASSGPLRRACEQWLAGGGPAGRRAA